DAPAMSMEQRKAQLLFEAANLLTDRAVREAQLIGRGAQVLQAPGGAKGRQVLQRKSRKARHAGKHNRPTWEELIDSLPAVGQVVLPTPQHDEATMSHPLSIPVQRPLAERWAHEVAEFIVCAWQKRREKRDLDRQVAAMTALSGAVLRDIGGPEALIHQAFACRHADA